MTYTIAAENNKQFNLTNTWKNPKEFRDGVNLQWVKSPEGKIGFLIRGRGDSVTVGYPTKVLKSSVYLEVECYPTEIWKNLEKI